jgi:hypothetical protein
MCDKYHRAPMTPQEKAKACRFIQHLQHKKALANGEGDTLYVTPYDELMTKTEEQLDALAKTLSQTK